jgi:hypothetical protein
VSFRWLWFVPLQFIEWHSDGWVHRSGVVQNGSCDFLYCETFFCREWWCFIFCRILSLGAVRTWMVCVADAWGRHVEIF